MTITSYLGLAGRIEGDPPQQPKDLTKLPRHEAEKLFFAEMLQELRCLRQTTTEAAARLTNRSVNNVLDVQTQVFPTSGRISLRYGAAAGAIEVSNWSAAGVVTVYLAGGVDDTAPTSGVGVYRVGAGATRTISCDSHQITLYGAAGDAVTWQVWTRGVDPVA